MVTKKVVLITQDTDLREAFKKSDTGEFEVKHSMSINRALKEHETIADASIVIFDIDTVPESINAILIKTISLKKKAPTSVLMVIGESVALNEVLKSSIQPLIYRAFNKPVNINQVLLSFDSAHKEHKVLNDKYASDKKVSVGPTENRETIETVYQQKSKWPLYSAVGALAVVAAAGFFLFGGGDVGNDAAQVETERTVPVVNTNQDQNGLEQKTNSQIIAEFNLSAAEAVKQDRRFNPSDSSALFFYDKALAIDPYDPIAYNGKRQLISELKSDYINLVKSGEFENALAAINILQAAEPLNLENQNLVNQLDATANSYIQDLGRNGTVDEIISITTMMDRIGSQLAKSKTTSDALKAARIPSNLVAQREQVHLNKIDAAIENGELIPPAIDNAFALIQTVREDSLVSESSLSPRVEALNKKIVNALLTSVNEIRFQTADEYLKYVQELNVDPQNTELLVATIERARRERVGGGGMGTGAGRGAGGMGAAPGTGMGTGTGMAAAGTGMGVPPGGRSPGDPMGPLPQVDE